jgi:hypothetical protein
MTFRIEDFEIMAFSFRITGTTGSNNTAQDYEAYGRSGDQAAGATHVLSSATMKSAFRLWK